jgi:diacylglycerol kinase
MPSPSRSWNDRFRDAFRGIKAGVRGQSSFFVHLFAAATVIVAGAILRVTFYESCLLILCIAGVLTAEMFNSAIESMAKAITGERHPHLGNSLDIAAAAVLVASIGAAAVGALIFTNRLALTLGWW